MKRHDVMYRILKKQSDKIAVLFLFTPKIQRNMKNKDIFSLLIFKQNSSCNPSPLNLLVKVSLKKKIMCDDKSSTYTIPSCNFRWHSCFFPDNTELGRRRQGKEHVFLHLSARKLGYCFTYIKAILQNR